MAKVIFKKVNNCEECPYFFFRMEDQESWYQCGLTDKILVSTDDRQKYVEKHEERYPFNIPEWCPLEDEDIFTKAVGAVMKSV